LPLKTLDDPTGAKKSSVWVGEKQEKEWFSLFGIKICHVKYCIL
jgi:hypothetical protein